MGCRLRGAPVMVGSLPHIPNLSAAEPLADLHCRQLAAIRWQIGNALFKWASSPRIPDERLKLKLDYI
ncbi:hypothetical protein BJY04DRAFT_188862 [Aspergillus karnatakaensis]|uniref:uncharacterized protein n=1 Tax=Aspergillus karnatakaensis TaxID=1810916 RepID=UPI003CCD32C5